MIVVDASALVEFLVGKDGDATEQLGRLLSQPLFAPHLLDFEVLSVLRVLAHSGKISVELADEALSEFFAFAITRYAAKPLAERVWALRHNYTGYDASYIALAEALDARLVTCDRKLTAGNHATRVTVIDHTE